MNTRTRTAAATGVALLALVSAGCSQESDSAAEAAQQFVSGTFIEQCNLTHPVRGGAADDCANREDRPVWPDHPTEVTAVIEWRGDGYAVTIPDKDGTADVFGMRLDGDKWKVAEFDQIEPADELTDNPACAALDNDGEGC